MTRAGITKKTIFFISLGSFLSLFLGVFLWMYSIINYMFYEQTGEQATHIIDIPAGSNLTSVADKLHQADIIANPFLFILAVKLRGKETQIQAGEYEITTPTNMAVIFDKLTQGKIKLFSVTVPEGLTSRQIVTRLTRNEHIVLDTLYVPDEGSLLPETYFFPRSTPLSSILEQMAKAQTVLMDELWPQRQAGLPIKSPYEAIILASIVEKESAVDSERNRIAGVFINRLRRNMRLESDPTIIYGLTGGTPLGRGLYLSEIDKRTPWNTYRVKGLPPTPISNPGRASIMAVLHPALTQALYFVADGSGGHAFSDNLAAHQRHVENWRRIERQRKARQNDE